jgi:hypothetical protein
MRKKILYYAMIACATAFIYVHTASNSTGIMGQSTGCGGGSCHGTSPTANTVVKIKLDGDSTSTTYIPGKKYSVVVSVANNSYTAAASRAGFDFTTTGGAFSAAPTGTIGMGTEIHHTTPKSMATTGRAEWTFDWTAPAPGSGPVIMNIAGNATNGNATNSGDAFGTLIRNLAEGVVSTPPSISGVTSGSITTTGAKLDASVNANGTSTNIFVEYGTLTSSLTRVATIPATATGSSATAVSRTLTGLIPNTTYNYRFAAKTAADSALSSFQTFKTSTNSTGSVVIGNKALSLIVFPNPSSASIKLDNLTNQVSKILAIDVQGRAHRLSFDQVGTSANASIEHLAKGSYIIRVSYLSRKISDQVVRIIKE